VSDTPPTPEGTLEAALGFELLEVGPELATGRAAVGPNLMQPFGLVHGGVYAAMAESLASVATYMAVKDEGNIAVGQSNNTTFMRPITSGHVNGEARPRHSGRTTWVWDVDITDDDGRLCATSRVTIAVRPAPAAR
jgi:1,4-dihydroxy-2-naphthoyl-CoA hydrolase